MTNFKVGDKVREKKRDLGLSTYTLTNHNSVCEVVAIYDSFDIEVKVLSTWDKSKIGSVYTVESNRMEIIREKEDVRECPTIIKLEQKFTLQIKDHVIELDKAEVTALREQLLEI